MRQVDILRVEEILLGTGDGGWRGGEGKFEIMALFVLEGAVIAIVGLFFFCT